MTIEAQDVVNDIDLDEIDWEQVIALQGAFDAVLAIEDDDERLDAAKALVAEMNS